ncbi:hypothetical protein F4818DRAFT_397454 [Hypoxylon cercidicola]|nr:hypothetical protein F4818DRAFT_397454 [Hypoxylon cercidicola]
MSEDLRVKLGKSKVESQRNPQRDPRDSWNPEAWAVAVKALRAGWRPAEPQFPVVIDGDGALDGPEKLQKLADLPSVPEVSTTRVAEHFIDYDEDGAQNADEIQIADVTRHQLLLLEKRTEPDMSIMVWFPDAETQKPIARRAYVVKSIKEDFRDMETNSGGQG